MGRDSRRHAAAGLMVALLLVAPLQGIVAGEQELGQGEAFESEAADPRASMLAAPEGFEASMLEAAPPQQLAAQLGRGLQDLEPVLEAAGQPIHPVWLSQDGEAMLAYIREHTDQATGNFTFEGPTAELDAVIAKAVAESLVEVEQVKKDIEPVFEDLRRLFAEGELPEGYEVRLPGEQDLAGEMQDAEAALREPLGEAQHRAQRVASEAYGALPPPVPGAVGGAEAAASPLAAAAPEPLPGLSAEAREAIAAYLEEHPEPGREWPGGGDERVAEEEPVSGPDDDPGGPGVASGDPVCSHYFSPIFGGSLWGCWAMDVQSVQVQRASYTPGSQVDFTVQYFVEGHRGTPIVHNADQTECEFRVRDPRGNVTHTGTLFGPRDTWDEVRLEGRFTLERDARPGAWEIDVRCLAHFVGVHPEDSRRAEFQVQATDLAIQKSDIVLRVNGGIPPENPSRWDVTVTATHTGQVTNPASDCSPVDYTVWFEVSGGAFGYQSHRTQCSGSWQYTDTWSDLWLGRDDVVTVIVDKGNAVVEADKDNNQASRKFGTSEVVRVFPDWKGAYLSGVVPPMEGLSVYALTQDSELAGDGLTGDLSQRVGRVEFFFCVHFASCSPLGTASQAERRGHRKLWELHLAPFEMDWSRVPPGEHILRAVAINWDGSRSEVEERRLVFWDWPKLFTWARDTWVQDGLQYVLEAAYIALVFGSEPGEKTIEFRLLGADGHKINIDKKRFNWPGLNIIRQYFEKLGIKIELDVRGNVKSTDSTWPIQGKVLFRYCPPWKNAWVEVGHLPFVPYSRGGDLIYREDCFVITSALQGKFADGSQSPESWKLHDLAFTIGAGADFTFDVLDYLLRNARVSRRLSEWVTHIGAVELMFRFTFEYTWNGEEGPREFKAGSGLQWRDSEFSVVFFGRLRLQAGSRNHWLGSGFDLAGNLRITLNHLPGNGFGWKELVWCRGGCPVEGWVQFGAWRDIFRIATLPQEIFFGQPEESGVAGQPEHPSAVTKPMDRTWLGPGYASFEAGENGTLVGRVWLGAKPTLAAPAADRRVVVYSHDVPEKPVGASVDLHFTAWDGEAWSAPAPVEDDDVDDLSPELAVGSSKEAGLLWGRLKEPAANTSLDDLARQVEMVFRRYDFVEGSWSEAVQLTDNDRYEKYHVLAGDGSGNYLAAWVRDEDDRPFSDGNDTLWVQPIVQGQPLPAVQVANVTTDQPPAVALLPGGFAMLAWVEGTVNESIMEDRRIQWVAGNPLLAAWTAPSVLSNTSHEARDPAFARDDLGRLSLTWRERVPSDEEGKEALLVDKVMEARLAGGSAGESAESPPMLPAVPGSLPPLPGVPPAAPRPLEAAFEEPVEIYHGSTQRHLIAPRLLHDSQGTRVLAWSDIGAEKGLWYKLLANGTAARNIAKPGAPSSASFALLEDDGAPFLFAVHVREEEEGNFSNFHIDVPQRSILADAAVEAFTVAPENPPPGSSADVEVRVANLGDVETGDFDLVLRDNGAAFKTIRVASLAPGEGITTTVAWDVPNRDEAHTLEALADEAGEVEDGDRGNNEASLRTVLPDPQVEDLVIQVQPGLLRVVGAVKNVGARVAPKVPVVLEVLEGGDAAQGVPPVPRELARRDLPALAPSKRGIVDFTLDPSVLPAGTHQLRLRVEAPEDFTPADSALQDQVRLDTDLDVALEAEQLPDSAAVLLQATVVNAGPVASPPTEVAFRSGDSATGPLIASVPLPALQPGQGAMVNATWTPPGPGLHHAYAVANPARSVAELDFGNNMAHEALRQAPLADLALDAGTLWFAQDGLEVRVLNLGEEPVGYAAVRLFGAGPVWQDFAIADLPAGGSAAARLPVERVNITALGPTSSLRLVADPGDRVREMDGDNNVLEAPMVAVRSTTHPDTHSWFPARDAAFTFSALPTLGVQGWSYVLDRSPGTEPDLVAEAAEPRAAFAALPNGEHWLHVRALTSQGPTGTLHYRFRVQAHDSAPPVTKLRLVEEHASHEGQVFVSERTRFELEARDPSRGDGSSATTGVASTHYQVDLGSVQRYAGPFTLAGLEGGPHNVTYWSVDAAGNAEAPQRLGVVLEVPLPPVAAAAALGFVADEGTLYADARASVALLAEEPAVYRTFLPRGVDRIEYRLDQGPWQRYQGPIEALRPGDASGAAHALEYRAWSRDGLA